MCKKVSASFAAILASIIGVVVFASPASASHSDAYTQRVRAIVQASYDAGVVSEKNYSAFQTVYPTWKAAVARAFGENDRPGGGAVIDL